MHRDFHQGVTHPVRIWAVETDGLVTTRNAGVSVRSEHSYSAVGTQISVAIMERVWRFLKT